MKIVSFICNIIHLKFSQLVKMKIKRQAVGRGWGRGLLQLENQRPGSATTTTCSTTSTSSTATNTTSTTAPTSSSTSHSTATRTASSVINASPTSPSSSNSSHFEAHENTEYFPCLCTICGGLLWGVGELIDEHSIFF